MLKNKLLFSLIELLFIIAIFSVLASLLQPTLTQLIGKSQNIECQLKMKQIGTIVTLYANDNDDQLPGPCTGRVFAWERNGSMLQFVAEYAEAEPFIQNPNAIDRRLGRNYKSYRQFMCPSNMDQPDLAGNNANDYYSRRVSYFTNNKYAHFRGTPYENHAYVNYFGDIETLPMRISDIPDPDRKVLIFDYDIPKGNPNPYFSIAPVHNNGGGRNALIFDLSFITQNSYTWECYD